MELNDKIASERKNTDERIDKLILEELTHEEGFFGKEGSIMIKKEAKEIQEGEEPAAEGQEAEGEGEGEEEKEGDGEGDDNKSTMPLEFKYTHLKEYMVQTFNAIKMDISVQMEKHENHLTLTTEKFTSVDKRVDIDMQTVIDDLKLQADETAERLFNVQKENIKTLEELTATHEQEIKNLKEQLEELGVG